MEKKSCMFTITIQLALCVAFYCAINLGHPRTPTYRIGIQRQSNEIYFISVRGGFRPLQQQLRLLKQIEKVVKAYKVGFVINISELGEDDPLLQHATRYFRSLRAPWYTTIAPRGEEPDYFFKQIGISNGTTLDIIALNTGSLRDFSSGKGNAELNRLSREVESSKSNWHIATGFHPLLCNQSLEQGNGGLDHMLQKLGVDAYLSGQSCANETRIGGPYLTIVSQGSRHRKQAANMFLLHGVSPLEIITYGVSFKGNIVRQSTIKQRGRDVI